MHKKTFTITELSREFDLTTRAIRFYEDRGLLSPGRKGRARIYSARQRVRLKLILRGKRLGFSLKEIQEVLDMYDADCGEAGQLQFLLEKIRERRDYLHVQKADIEATLRDLREIEKECLRRLRSM